MLVVMDSRESASSGIKELLEKENVKVMIMDLPAGDYYIPSAYENLQGYLIERKKGPDFVHSVATGRLWDQVKRLMEVSKDSNLKCLMIFEESLATIKKFTQWNTKAIAGILSSLYADWGIDVVFMPSKYWSALFIYQLAKRVQGDKEAKVHPLRRVDKASDEDPPFVQARKVLEGLPNIGPVVAERMLRHFGSLKRIFNATIEELMEVDGIGRTKAEKIFRLINQKVVD